MLVIYTYYYVTIYTSLTWPKYDILCLFKSKPMVQLSVANFHFVKPGLILVGVNGALD